MSEELININMRKSDFDFITDLANEIKNQDNRSTALPYYYVVKCVNDVPAPEGNGQFTKYVDMESGDYQTYDSREECKEQLIKDGCFEDEAEATAKKLERLEFAESFQEENIFLTERGFNQHMELNGHNYRHHKKYYSYVKHAFRNPEIKRLLEIVGRFSNK